MKEKYNKVNIPHVNIINSSCVFCPALILLQLLAISPDCKNAAVAGARRAKQCSENENYFPLDYSHCSHKLYENIDVKYSQKYLLQSKFPLTQQKEHKMKNIFLYLTLYLKKIVEQIIK